jgi:hypothetical protein
VKLQADIMSNKNRTRMRTGCVQMTGPDVQMDQRGDTYEPANPLPVKCPHCTLPDLDFVPQPYVLTKGVAAPSEISPAQMGNFLVRERTRRILELVVPKACQFYPTIEKKTKKQTEWTLAVPTQMLTTPGTKASAPFCSKCSEPKLGPNYLDAYWSEMKRYDTGGVDIFKSSVWDAGGDTVEGQFEECNSYRKKDGEPLLPWSHWGVEPPTHPERWTRVMLGRDLYFSIRLEQLLKRAKIKGQLVRRLSFKEVTPTPEDEAWIEEKLRLLAEHGLVDALKPAGGKTAAPAGAWLRQYLKRNTRKSGKPVDFAAVEKKHKVALPQDYKDFISTVGPKSFENVNQAEGFTATILPPNKLDFRDYRRGRVPDLEGDQAEIDGVMFASTDHGDCFVFDVSVKGKDYPVYWHDHEQNSLEPFASSFAECVKRFAQRN